MECRTLVLELLLKKIPSILLLASNPVFSLIKTDSLDSMVAVLLDTCLYCSAAFLSLSCAAANWMEACCNRSDRDRSTRSLDACASFRLAWRDSI